ncbi:aminodeoxychorismate synthase component I [Undibacterium baiyunense]|uniref:aminodeoxychorismate synthase component I n=1 Tax=Undibacterium baiyunense TaxID=2828731 RepID=UPI002E2FF30A
MSSSSTTTRILNSVQHCFALLDDAQSDEANSRFYSDLIEHVECPSTDHWLQLWTKAQQALDAGYFVLAVLAYETGAQLHTISARTPQDFVHPATQLLIFRQCQHWTKLQVSDWLAQQSAQEVAGIRAIRANVDQDEFTNAIEKIRAYIAAGDTYQVNYTYRLHFETYGSAVALYRVLRLRQPVPFAALIALPNGGAILSLSPELFIRHQQGQLIAKPMKGTAAASGDDEQDRMIAEQLSLDPKNRAENLMIVDLLRNDLGRIAETGSVKVPALFEVQRFTSVLQMTSTISARLRHDLELDTIMSALFPCGSITGAPKHRTMEIIREIETEDRGIYTGAIGWFDPPASSRQIGDFCLSVPIRTLALQAEDAYGCRTGVMGVGAGIVFDSKAPEEFAECALKAKFLTGLRPDFHLFETIYATYEDGCRHLERHLNRLEKSANYFAFVFDKTALQDVLKQACSQLQAAKPYRLRLSLKPDGEPHIQYAELTPITEPVKLMISSEPCTTSTVFLAHKSSHRAVYDHAWQQAESLGAFDSLFINANGHVTEGGRSNLFVRLGTQWFTPPLHDGVLPGVMRSVLLEDPKLQVIERSISLDELKRADEIIVCNALRGAMQAKLC